MPLHVMYNNNNNNNNNNSNNNNNVLLQLFIVVGCHSEDQGESDVSCDSVQWAGQPLPVHSDPMDCQRLSSGRMTEEGHDSYLKNYCPPRNIGRCHSAAPGDRDTESYNQQWVWSCNPLNMTVHVADQIWLEPV